MQKIKIMTSKNSNDSGYLAFEIPWEWITEDGVEPNLNDLESSAERGVTTGYLFRNRMAEVPEYKLKILKRLTQKQVWPFLKIIRKTKIYMTYFEKYENAFITTAFYVPKPSMPVHQFPKDNNTDNIIYQPFEITFTGYGDVHS